jgi:hypothetical protein
MNETTVISLAVVACVSVIVIGVASISRPTLRFCRSYSPLLAKFRRSKEACVDDWDQASLLYKVPSSTIGFLAAEYVFLWLTICIAADGFGALSIESFFSLWLGVIAGLYSILGIFGFVGIICATVYGVHQDLPELRIRTLAVCGVFGILVGLGLRFD